MLVLLCLEIVVEGMKETSDLGRASALGLLFSGLHGARVGFGLTHAIDKCWCSWGEWVLRSRRCHNGRGVDRR